MADHTAATAAHATLTASTVDTVTINEPTNRVAVINRGSDAISYCIGGSDVAAPTELGDNTFVVPAGGVAVHDTSANPPLVVKLISSGTPGFSVQAV